MLNDKAIQEFLKKGFIVLKESVPIDLINNIKKDLLNATKEKIFNSKKDLHYFDNGEISSAHNLINYVPSYVDLIRSEKISKFFKSIFINVSHTNLNSSYFAKPKFQGLETKTHQDNAFFCMDPPEIATCWMPLSAVDKKNGCLYYYEGSHKLGNLKHVPMGNLGASMCLSAEEMSKIENNFKKTYVELNLGDCIIHSALVAHGSEANTSGLDRNAFNFSVGSKNVKRNEKLFREYQSKLDNFLEKIKN
jgi:phytanoyl-CoA hydroxylase